MRTARIVVSCALMACATDPARPIDSAVRVAPSVSDGRAWSARGVGAVPSSEDVAAAMAELESATEVCFEAGWGLVTTSQALAMLCLLDAPDGDERFRQLADSEATAPWLLGAIGLQLLDDRVDAYSLRYRGDDNERLAWVTGCVPILRTDYEHWQKMDEYGRALLHVRWKLERAVRRVPNPSPGP